VRTGRHFAAALIVGLACVAARAQEPTIIESEGRAFIEVAPDEVRFHFTKSFDGPTLNDITTQAAAFEKAAAKALDDLDVTPLRQDPVRLTVPQLQKASASGRVGVRFAVPAASAGTGAGGGPPPAELAEKMRKAAVSLLADVEFAGFAVGDPAPAEQDVVSRASENALYHAEALGELIAGSVTGVERISVEETRWEGLEPVDGALPIPPVVSCHARVRISYQYTPAR
jgi:hypothetical protein